jgi:hypothetical protein
MPAVARGKFFFSMSPQISRIFVIMRFVALASLGLRLLTGARASAKHETGNGDQSSVRRKGSANDEGCAVRIPYNSTSDRTTVKTDRENSFPKQF